MIQNWHICVVFGGPEVAGDVITSQNVNTIEGYIVVNFEIASSSSYWENKKKIKKTKNNFVCLRQTTMMALYKCKSHS